VSGLDQLSALDEKFVPVLARGLRQGLDVVSRRAPTTTAGGARTASDDRPVAVERAAPEVPPPTREPTRQPTREPARRARREVAGELNSIDQRVFGRLPGGGAGGFRALIWAGVAVVAVAAISGVVYAVHDSGGHASTLGPVLSTAPAVGQSIAPSAFSTLPDPATAPSALAATCPLGTDPSGRAQVGPLPGTVLSAYIPRRRAVLATCANVSGDVPVVAVVSLATAQTPEQVAATLGPVTAVAEYIQIPVTGAVPYTLRLSGVDTPGSSQLAGLQAAYSGGAQSFETDANAREGTAGAVSGSAADLHLCRCGRVELDPAAGALRVSWSAPGRRCAVRHRTRYGRRPSPPAH
jgi:hypothetical protein